MTEDTAAEKKDVSAPGTERIIPTVVEDEVKRSYLDYSMSVIVSRALPDVRDGLKPVHRRVLFAMNELGMASNKPFKKSARIVGEVIGKYHPHGDSAAYDTLVRMAQDFSLRYPLIQGQGNFGSVDGDSAAAMRYCVVGDTLLLTDKGMKKIGDISPKAEARIDMGVLTYQGRTKKAVRFFNSGKHKTIRLLTNQGYEIEGSYNHPVMTWTVDGGFPHIKWKLLEEITSKDVVLINRQYGLFSKLDSSLARYHPVLNERAKKCILPKKMTSDLAFLLGALVSEGSFHNGQILFNNLDVEFYDKVKTAVYSQFEGVELYERRLKKSRCYEFSIYYGRIIEFLKNIGLMDVLSDKKEIPFSILQSRKSHVSCFLSGLFEGDGSVLYKTDKRHGGKSIELTYSSKSRILVHQLKTVLLNFGIVTTAPYMDKRNGCYKLIISGMVNVMKFREEIGFSCYRKKSVLECTKELNVDRMSKTEFIPFLNEYLRKKYDSSFIRRNNFDRFNKLVKNYEKLASFIDAADNKLILDLLRNNYFFNKVKTVERCSGKKTVYSVRVNSSCHSFIANGFINHNTEARLSRISEEILEDIKKDTVDFQPNFDGELKEPVVLPCKIPNLLVNGSSGIAVGMATNIPPHNMGEVIDGTVALIDNPEATAEDLMEHISGPDFPTGGIISGTAGIRDAYTTGRGKVKIRAKTDVEEVRGRSAIIVTEIPYQVNKAMLIEQIADLVRSKSITGIHDIRDESDRDGMRVVIELKADATVEIVLNQLFKHTRLETTFGINFLGLIDNQPRLLNLTEIMQTFIGHRKEVVTRRTRFDLLKAEERAHILEGLITALDDIDNVVQKIKQSRDVEVARNMLMTDYSLSEVQAKAILDMRLQKLASLEQEKIKDEHKSLIELISELKSVLADDKKVFAIIKKELQEMREKYADPRKTDISLDVDEDISVEDLIEEEDMVVTITHTGYIKRLPVDTYKRQGRGGRGVIGASANDEDFVEHLFIASTHANVLFFTNSGQVHWLKVYNIPVGSRQAKGKAIVNLVGLKQGEQVKTFIPVMQFDDQHYIMMCTKSGTVKKTALEEFSRPRRGGIRAMNISESDELIDTVLTDGTKNVIIATRNGMAVRFSEGDVRPMGRAAAGVRGITLKDKDAVIGMVLAEDERTLLTVTEHGYGKRSPVPEYRLIKRGGVGVKNIICSERNGKVVAIRSVTDDDELMLISEHGIIIRTAVKQISTIGRVTQGVRIMKLEDGDRLRDAAKIVND